MITLHRTVTILLLIGLMSTILGCAATRTRESTGQYIDDSAITTKVKAAIFNNANLKSFQINVKTFKGAVQLSGFVNSRQSISRAGDLARGVEGVVSVKNSLIVK